MAILSNKSEFVKDLMKALDIDPSGTIGFSLFVRINEVVTVEVETIVEEPKYGESEIKRYRIIKEEIVEDDGEKE